MDCFSLISNHGNKKIGNHLIEAIKQGDSIYIASAYFNEIETLKKIHDKSGKVKLVVLLDSGTSDDALSKALELKKLEVKYFTSKFHSKFYIVKDYKAIVGSANFTYAGLKNNEEVAISFTEHNSLKHLTSIFLSYWEDAKPLTQEILCAFKGYIQSNQQANSTYRESFQIKAGIISPKNNKLDISRKIEIKQRELLKISTMTPEKLDFVFFIMNHAEKFLRERDGICKKEEFRHYIISYYGESLYLGWEDDNNNAFGWAFNLLFHLDITELATRGNFYKLRDYSAS